MSCFGTERVKHKIHSNVHFNQPLFSPLHSTPLTTTPLHSPPLPSSPLSSTNLLAFPITLLSFQQLQYIPLLFPSTFLPFTPSIHLQSIPFITLSSQQLHFPLPSTFFPSTSLPPPSSTHLQSIPFPSQQLQYIPLLTPSLPSVPPTLSNHLQSIPLASLPSNSTTPH